MAIELETISNKTFVAEFDKLCEGLTSCNEELSNFSLNPESAALRQIYLRWKQHTDRFYQFIDTDPDLLAPKDVEHFETKKQQSLYSIRQAQWAFSCLAALGNLKQAVQEGDQDRIDKTKAELERLQGNVKDLIATAPKTT